MTQAGLVFGLTPMHLEILKSCISRELKAGEVCTVWIFGSRAQGTHRSHSDVDLLLESHPPLSLEQVSRIQESLEESDFPFKADLIRANDLYEAYRDQVNRDRKKLFSV